jgi:hypothetical protein
MPDRRNSESIVTRGTVPVGEDIGFLPGTEEEKMGPWMGALDDNLEVLSRTDGGAGGDGRSVRLVAGDGRSAAHLSPLPRNARIRMRVECRAAGLTLNLHGSAAARGNEIRILPDERRVSVTGATAISGVDGLDRPFTLDIIAMDRILDICVNQRRTLVNWVPDAAGDRLTLTVEKGSATCDRIEAVPLRRK